MQTLTINQEEFAIVPIEQYQELLRDNENKKDVSDVVEYREKLKNREEEAIPSEFAERLIFNENPFLVWREYRRLKLKDLGVATGIDVATLSRIENSKRDPNIKQLKTIASALNINTSDLLDY